MLELQQQGKQPASAAADEPTFCSVRDYVLKRPQEFVAALGELYVVGVDVQLFSDPHARADLLALDRQGVATVVAVEREGEHSLLEHGLMCAGLVAGWQPQFFFLYPSAGPAENLRGFLEVPEEQINRKQRVVLVAHSHEYAVYSAAQWLAQRHGIEIWCVQGRVDAASGRLDLQRLGPESGHTVAEPAGVVRVILPRPSAEAPEASFATAPGLPLQPALDPLTTSVQEICHLQTIWKPDVEAAAARSIEGRLQQILDEELREAGAETAEPPGVEPGAPASADSVTPATPETAAQAAETEARTQAEAPPVQAAVPGPAAVAPGADVAAGAESAVRAAEARPAPVVREEPEAFEVDRRKVLLACLVVAAVLALAAIAVLRVRRVPATSGVESAADHEPPVATLDGGILTNSVQDRAGRPIPGARLYYAGESLLAGPSGEFQIKVIDGKKDLLVKAAGYRQTKVSIEAKQPIRLEPLDVRGYYLSHSHVADSSRRDSILQLIRGTSANAVVMGVKDVTGRLNVVAGHPIAKEIGADSRAAAVELARQVTAWKAEKVYTIALLALFKDDLLARSKPELALKSILSRQAIVDPDGIAWADPASPVVRDYNIEVAKAAAAAGFDEIHFDFIRYPAETPSDEGGSPAEYDRRLATLVSFLRSATRALAPYNVYVSASVFGAVCSMPRAGVVGQKIEEFAEQLDYVSPMLYPSYFEPGQRYADPLRQSYQVVYENLGRAARRLGGQSRKLRPWLQNFPDSASAADALEAVNIRNQVKAAEDARASGWMLWDSRNRYRNTGEALNLLKTERSQARETKTETVRGGSLMPVGGVGSDEPPTANPETHFRLLGVLLLAGCCFGVLYAAVRAAWLFHRWTKTGSLSRPPVTGGESGAPAWLRTPASWRV